MLVDTPQSALLSDGLDSCIRCIVDLRYPLGETWTFRDTPPVLRSRPRGCECYPHVGLVAHRLVRLDSLRPGSAGYWPEVAHAPDRSRLSRPGRHQRRRSAPSTAHWRNRPSGAAPADSPDELSAIAWSARRETWVSPWWDQQWHYLCHPSRYAEFCPGVAMPICTN